MGDGREGGGGGGGGERSQMKIRLTPLDAAPEAKG